jgi:hypothetical protein
MRIYLTSERLDQLTETLTPDELAILKSLSLVRLATARQLERLHFAIGDRGRQRRRTLQAMTDRRLIARLDRLIGGRKAGSSGYLYALDIAGQRVLEHLGGQSVRRPTTPGGPFIRHALAVTELYVALVEAERRGETELLTFEAEPASWRRHPGPGGGTVTLKPDAYVRLGSGSFIDHWFIEVDRGTEAPATLNRKIDAVRHYWGSGIEQARSGVFPRTLWLVPHERRYQVVADARGRQPSDSWMLHQVTVYNDAIGLMTGGQP